MFDFVNLLILVIKIVLVAVGLLSGFAVMTWVERRLLAGYQVRYGPNRVGPMGLLQPVADGLKLAMKEDFTPTYADKAVYIIAPMISMMASLMAAMIIPFGPPTSIFGRELPLSVAGDVSIGFLFLLGVTSLGVYGVVLAGWSSGSKYSLLGGLRSSAQMISYELGLGLSLVSLILASGSMVPQEIMQSRIWILPQFPAFVIFFICMIAETNRAPFDLPEAEQELVAGFHTEYASFKFALFYMGEYVAMIVFSALAATLFMGGWRGPGANGDSLLGVVLGLVYLTLKIGIFMFIYIWMRATLPRLRYDRLMALGWKVLLPVALIWVAITALWMLLHAHI